MTTPCNLTQQQVEKYNQRSGDDKVPLIRNIYQNIKTQDGSDGICGRTLGAHPRSNVL
jgi:hypothetical protein